MSGIEGWADFEDAEIIERLNHSLFMLVALIPHSDDPAAPDEVTLACEESWIMHHRVLIEFFCVGSSRRNVADADRFITGWRRTVPRADDLRIEYGWASQAVAHIGIPRPSRIEFSVHPALLAIKADLMLDVAEWFVEDLGTVRPDLVAPLQTGLRTARRRLEELA